MNTIYLCGQITGLSYTDARFGWRAQVHDALRQRCVDVECLSPMRGKGDLKDIRTLSALGNPDSVMSTAKAITTRDRFDVRRSDLLFCNVLGMDRVSQGSMIEFGWADAFRIPILCCIEADGSNPHEHAMAQDLIGWRCDSLEQGIDVVASIFWRGL